jgi:hypothetical protein
MIESGGPAAGTARFTTEEGSHTKPPSHEGFLKQRITPITRIFVSFASFVVQKEMGFSAALFFVIFVASCEPILLLSACLRVHPRSRFFVFPFVLFLSTPLGAGVTFVVAGEEPGFPLSRE